MASSRPVVLSFTALVLVLAAGSFSCSNRSRPPEEVAQEAAEKKAKHLRDTKAAERLIDVKNTSLADLENGQFASADPGLLNLATASARDPVSRDWPIERLMAVEAIDQQRDPNTFQQALDRAETALNLESAMEPRSPERHYLASKFAQAQGSSTLRIIEQRTAAGTAPGDAVLCSELYQAQRSGTDADRRDSEGTLRTLKDLVPGNLYVQLEWLGVQVRRKDVDFDDQLTRVSRLLVPIVAEIGSDAADRLKGLIQNARSAANAGNWEAVGTNLAAIDKLAEALPELAADRRRVERGLSWHVISDFSPAYYQAHRIERRIPSAGKPVHFRELDLSGPLAAIADAREARFIDFDQNGRLDIAVLRGESFEIFARDQSGRWEKVTATPLPRGGYDHFLAVDLGGDRRVSDGNPAKSPGLATDIVLFGPAGVLVLQNLVRPGAKSRTFQAIDAPTLSRATKDALSIAVCDLNEDGLLDLVVSSRSHKAGEKEWATPLVFANEGDRHFRDITPRSGIGSVPVGGTALLAVDWDNDLDVDLLAPWVESPSGSPGGITFLKGHGFARFHPQRFRVQDSAIQTATALAVLDADSNGSWDLLASGPHGMMLLLTSTVEHGRVETIGVEPISDFAFDQVLAFDYDNDGCPDLVAWNREAVHCFHGTPEGHFEPADRALPPALGVISSADFGDFDQDGDSDLIIVKIAPAKTEPGKSETSNRTGRLALLQNEGGNANNWIDVRLDAHPTDAKAAASTRVPPCGLGSTLCLKIRGVSQTQIVQKPITHFGIGTLDSADVLRVLWTTGGPVNVFNPAKNTTVTQRPPSHPSP
ncbi:MAG TPA: CRTAC1 family protein [Planctomycetaceae bacterium]|nr:CRTAC1 family protein [Planctomycetaceae bacterium]